MNLPRPEVGLEAFFSLLLWNTLLEMCQNTLVVPPSSALVSNLATVWPLRKLLVYAPMWERVHLGLFDGT